MNQSASAFDESDYVEFLTDTCCDTLAMDYFVDETLVAVAICDRGDNSWSAVYTFFDPEYSHLSLGTYSILKQIDVCREHSVQWLYLGYYIENCSHMRYKEVYRPHQRLIDGAWQAFGK
jgi:arginine-tRNA-protein transferase